MMMAEQKMQGDRKREEKSTDHIDRRRTPRQFTVRVVMILVQWWPLVVLRTSIVTRH